MTSAPASVANLPAWSANAPLLTPAYAWVTSNAVCSAFGLFAYGYDASTLAFVPAVSSSLPKIVPVFWSCTLIAFSIGCRESVSNTRDAPPFANEKPALPAPSDESLNDAAAKPEACQARGVGEGEGEGDAAALGTLAGTAGGFVCANAGTAPSAHAAANAATSVFEAAPRECESRAEPALRTALGRWGVERRRRLRRWCEGLAGHRLRERARRRSRREHEPRGDQCEECDHREDDIHGAAPCVTTGCRRFRSAARGRVPSLPRVR